MKVDRYNSSLENEIAEYLINTGHIVLHSGWPDFLVVCPKTMRSYAIEVKTSKDKLNEAQKLMHKYLGSIGLTVHIVRSKDELIHLRGSKLLTPLQFITDENIYGKIDEKFKKNITYLKSKVDTNLKTMKRYIEDLQGVQERLSIILTEANILPNEKTDDTTKESM